MDVGTTSHPDDDLTEISFHDPHFLMFNGQLTHENVLAYFERSQFYQHDSINEHLRMQTRFNVLNASQLDPKKLRGILYDVIDYVENPPLWTIGKWNRISEDRDVLVAIYYIAENVIYQAPDLHTLIANRVSSALQTISESFQNIVSESTYVPSIGRLWKRDVDFIEEIISTAKSSTNASKPNGTDVEMTDIINRSSSDTSSFTDPDADSNDDEVISIHDRNLMRDELIASSRYLDSIVTTGWVDILSDTSSNTREGSTAIRGGSSRLDSVARSTPPVQNDLRRTVAGLGSPTPSHASASSAAGEKRRKLL